MYFTTLSLTTSSIHIQNLNRKHKAEVECLYWNEFMKFGDF